MIRLASSVVLALSVVAVGCGDSSTCPAPCGQTTQGSGGGGTGEGGSGQVRPADIDCKASFAGNYTATNLKAGKCATLAKDKKGQWVLTLKVNDAAQTAASFTLGASPSPGKLGPGTGDWTINGVSSAPCTASNGTGCAATCQFAAGSDSVPSGTFSLQLTQVDLDDPKPVVHGVVEATEMVHPGSGTDCGTGDTETLAIVF